MTCYRLGDAVICINPWGRLKLGNRYVMVDFHEYCGPSFEWVKGGKPYDPVDENDPIWPLFDVWHKKHKAAKARRAARAASDTQGGEG